MPPQQPKPPHRSSLIKVIRTLAAQDNITFSSHAFDGRMGPGNRGIEINDVLSIFRLGDIEGEIRPGKNA